MKLAIALGACLMLVSTLSFADPTPSMLSVGKPAGIQRAQEIDNTTLYVITGLAVLGIVIAVAASGGDNSSASNTAPPVPTQH